MKGLYKFDIDVFYKLFYGAVYGSVSEPMINCCQYSDGRVDMFKFSFIKYINMFKQDILGSNAIRSLAAYNEKWFEFWENPSLIFENKDIIYDGTLLYERIHGCGFDFNIFDENGYAFINKYFLIIENCIQYNCENPDVINKLYLTEPVSFDPAKNLNVLFDYLRTEWIEFKKNLEKNSK